MAEHYHIAVIMAGVDEEYQNTVLNGVISCAEQHQVNISVFTAFGGVITSSKYDIGEYNIYNLINFRHFDAAVLMTNTICDPDEKQKIINAVKAAGIPAVFLDCDDEQDFYNIRIDNTLAMREIIQHVINEHEATVLNYISGPLSNPEAQARYEAFLQVMAENRLIADARRIYFGEFRGHDGEQAVQEFLASGMKLPDGIICANDAMALGAIRALERHGISVDADIMVTGFDDTYSAQHFCPSLTTVSRPLKEMGYQAIDILLRDLKGEHPHKTIELKAHPVYRESCGCSHKDTDDIRTYKKGIYRVVDGCRADIAVLNRMTSQLAEQETASACMEVIARFVPQLGCRQFMICLNAEWDQCYTGPEAQRFQKIGYTKTMSAPLIWSDGSITAIDTFASADMNPLPLSGGGHCCYYLPLHFRDRSLGYVVMTDTMFPPQSMVFHSILLNISNSIENVRKLLHLNSVIAELDKLYVRDPLCGIFNRNGFIREADTLYKECIAKNKPLMISFIDMDGLKLINDNYGHKEGDFALQRLASVIQDCCSGNMICARFGGDEFIIIGTGYSNDDAETLERLFQKRLDDMNHIINKPYELEASIGTTVSAACVEVPLFTMITTADEIMYERKKKKKTSRYLRKE